MAVLVRNSKKNGRHARKVSRVRDPPRPRGATHGDGPTRPSPKLGAWTPVTGARAVYDDDELNINLPTPCQ
jgi:hypothetical protein